MPIPDAVDEAELVDFLSSTLDEPVDGVELLADGLNLVLAVVTPTDSRAYVLRKPNKLRETPLFNGIKFEYRLLERLVSTDVPAPVPVHYCEDTSLLGDPFVVTTHLPGDPVPLGTDLPERFRNERSRRRVGTGLIDTLAAVHSLDASDYADVCDRKGPIEQVADGLERLDAAGTVTDREFPTLRSVGDWIHENPPPETQPTLVHGDYRPGNVLFSPDEAGRPVLTGVLDWETAMLGDPLTELGYLLLRWRDPGDPTPSITSIESRYGGHDGIEWVREANERGLAPFTAAPGSPTRGDLIDRYERRTGLPFDDPRFYLAHAAFMLGTVWADLDRHRIVAGGEPSREPLVEYVALLGEAATRGEFDP